jgi:hypothetical protein
MRTLKLALPAAILTAGFLVCNISSYGKPAYAAKEKKQCTFCHEKADPTHKDVMAKNLNDAGKYYAAHDHSLDGYKGK